MCTLLSVVFCGLASITSSQLASDDVLMPGRIAPSCSAPVQLATAGLGLLQRDVSRSRTIPDVLDGQLDSWHADEWHPDGGQPERWPREELRQGDWLQQEEGLQQVPGQEVPRVRQAVPPGYPQAIKVRGQVPADPPPHEQEQLKFFSKHWSLIVVVILILMMVTGIVAFDVVWEKAQAELERESTLASRSSAFSHQLVRNLLPSISVENYQFRGMEEKASTLSMQFEQVGLEIPSKGRVLESVTGELKPGRMTAIMGPSGAGKTTFMNVLCGKAGYGKTTGQIMINGKQCKLSEFKPVIGYVPQDDIVHELLTVREQIHFSAQLRNPTGTKSQTLCNIVDDVLAVLQMEHIQRSIVGGVETRGISGGQRKRVNIGLELAAFPTLIFLDEPTSGLDSTTSLAIVRSLKKMTQLGITIVMVIHQPRQSLMTLFDDVLLLGRGGRTVYLGSAHQMSAYFEGLGFKKPLHENPADWYCDIVSGGVPTSKVEDFKADMLPGMWVHKVREGWKEERRNTPDWTDEEDCAVLARALEDEWEKVSGSQGGALTADELTGLLGDCAREQPEAEVMRNVVDQMAGGEKEITKDKFVDFFVGLRGVVAKTPKNKLVRTITMARSSDGQDPDLCRVLPGCFNQYRTLLRRRLVLVRRLHRQRLLDISCVLVCSVLIGWLHRGTMNFRDPQLASKILIFHLGLSLLTVVSCLRVFGSNWPLWYRECGSGLNIFAAFCARLTVDTLDIFLNCVLFTAVYFLLAQPTSPFRHFFVPCLCVSFAVSGWAYFISAVVPPANATLVGILFTLASCGFLGDPGLAYGIWAPISVTRWSVQMTYLVTADAAGSTLKALDGQVPQWLQDEIHSALQKHPLQPMDIFKACGYMSTAYTELAYRIIGPNQRLGYWYGGMTVLVSMSLLLRILAYIGLRWSNHKMKN
mmetsp:Transcript_133402/g.231758  ORF Transcript_133402/g.231758 Transcript_133402/m.231758 type:complete len:924 (-) Transcript_133402:138-2909(-)